jgi:hypothetical protein
MPLCQLPAEPEDTMMRHLRETLLVSGSAIYATVRQKLVFSLLKKGLSVALASWRP